MKTQTKRKRDLTPLYYLFPALLGMLIIYGYPLFSMIYNSFMDYNLSRSATISFTGLTNYITLFSDNVFRLVVQNTLIYVFLSVVLQFVLGFFLALLLSSDFKGKGFYQTVVFIPWAVAGFLVAIMFQWMFNAQWGVINDLLMKTGILSSAHPFLSDVDTALYTTVIASVWYGVPFFAIMILAALQSVPEDMYEAAKIDGANSFVQFWKITVPFIKPVLILTVLLRIIWMFNSADLIYVMTAGGPANSSHILPTYLFEKAYVSFDFGLASAISTISVLFLVIFALLYLFATQFKKSGDF